MRYFDGHCDTVKRLYANGEVMASNTGHIALDRVGAFDGYAQMFAFFYNADYAPKEGLLHVTKGMYDLFRRELAANPGKLVHCRSAAEVNAAAGQGKICALLSIEGGDLLECDPDNIEQAHKWGVKLINPTWNVPNALSGTHCRESERGLSDVGRTFVRTANQAGILMDVSHLSQPGFWDLMDITEKPVVASHSNARGVYDHSRGLTDDQFRAICQTGGVVGLNFYSAFVGEKPTMDMLIRHLEHFLELGGENHIGLGGDLDGCESTVEGIDGVQDVPKLYLALQNRGYSEALLDKIFWDNWMRLF